MFDLPKLKFNRCKTPEGIHFKHQLAALRINADDLAFNTFESTVLDADNIADLELSLGPGSFRGPQHMNHLFRRKRFGLVGIAQESHHTLDGADKIPGILIHKAVFIIKIHTDKNIAGEKLAGSNLFNTHTDIFNFFLGNICFINPHLIIKSDLAVDGISHLLFMTGKGVYEAYIPEEKVEDIRMGVKKVTTRKFFPGYILVRMDLYDEDGVVNQNAWYFVRSIQGVMGFLGNANRPKPLPEEEVVHVLRPPEAPRAKGQFKVGEVLCIKDGAFKGVEGKVMSVDTERGKLMLEVHTFGRPTPIEFEFWQVEHVV